VQDAAPPRDAIGIVLIADARLLPHCSYAVRRPPRTSWLWGAASLSRHVKSLNGELEFAERGLTSCRADHRERGCAQCGHVFALPGPAVPGATFIKGTMAKLTTVPPAQHGAA
jgi:hypothetical protein